MRLIVFIVATLVGSGSTIAQNWREYSYPDQFFAIAFPSDPQMEATTYQIADDRSVEAHVYSVHQDDAVFKVTVAEVADTGLEESVVIDHAIKMMSAGGEVKVNIPHRVNRVYGRQLSIAGPDGIRSMVAVFDYNGRLYQIEGKALPTGNDATAGAIRFAQSLTFTGGGSNRSAEEIRAGQAGCSGAGGSVAVGVPGDDRRLEIRCRRQRSFLALVNSLNSGDRLTRCPAGLFIAQPTPKIWKSERTIRTGDERDRTSSPGRRFDGGAAGPLIAAALAPHPPTLMDRPSIRKVMEGEHNEDPRSLFDLRLAGEPCLRAKCERQGRWEAGLAEL